MNLLPCPSRSSVARKRADSAPLPRAMAGRALQTLALGALLLLAPGMPGLARAQDLTPGQVVDPATLAWPRTFAANGYEFALYQPCISTWVGNQLEGRLVVAVRPAGTTNEAYGIVSFQARTEIDKVNRLVTLEEFAITKADFPTQPEKRDLYLGALETYRKSVAHVIPLDHLEAVFAASGDVEKAKVQELRNDPPRIIYATQPSLLILVDGAPILKPLMGDYDRVVNTRPVLLWNKSAAGAGFYLYAANHWYTSPSLDGPWYVPASPAADLAAALAAATATKQVDLLAPEEGAPADLLQVFVSTTPAELIETQGEPNLLPIDGTHLRHVANSGNAIFFYIENLHYYVLISGRWFKSSSLRGEWTFVAPGELPADFQKIPPDHEKSNVLASVPGTQQAQEAVIANSIPQTATIQVAQASLTVPYEGAPSFAPIPSTTLSYATNTVTPVIQVGAQSYYACQGGVWFVSSSPVGPWMVAGFVPASIYSIPVSSPVHYVTYAYVYGSAPGVVYVGYTPGYAGTVVAPGGVVVYGTGYYYPPVVVGTTYICYPPTYGYGASMALGASVGFAFGYAAGANTGCWCQPHWGCYAYGAPYGSYSHVNVNSTSFYTQWGTAVHATGSYGHNAYTGTSWGSQHAASFNPYTGATATASRGAAVNPYSGNYAAGKSASYYNPSTGAQAAGRSGVTGNAYTGNYAAGRQEAGYNPTTGNYAAGQTAVTGNARTGTAAVSSQGVAGNAKTGNSVAWNNGNMYADKSGNMYNYNQGSGAQKYNSSTGSWQSVNKPAGATATSAQSQMQAREPSAASSGASRESAAESSLGEKGGGGEGSGSWADRAGSAQSSGAERFNNWSGSGGGSRGGGGGRHR